MSTEHDSNDDREKFTVQDPEDYQKTRRLKQIHRTKREVLKIRRKREELIQDYDNVFRKSGLEMYKQKLATAVSQYGSELYPLVQQGREKGVLDERHLRTQVHGDAPVVDVIEFIHSDGSIEYQGDTITPPEHATMDVYRQLNQILTELGLGLEIEEEQATDWEI